MTSIFVSLECMLYVSFMVICSLNGETEGTISLKFLSIVLCSIYSVLLFLRKQAHCRILSLSFLFLICSDYFLLFTNDILWGLCSFFMVQVCIFLSLNLQRIRHCKTIFVVSFLGMSFCLVLELVFGLEILSVVVSLYFLLFTYNLITALIQSRRESSKRNHLFLLGMSLYYLCDIFVGIFNLASYVPVSGVFYEMLYGVAAIGMWMFYLPGMVLIAMSNRKTLYGIK